MSCNYEAPSVEALHGELGDTAKVIGVAWAGTDSSYADFVSRHGLTFPNVADSAGDVYAAFGVASQPAWVFLVDGRQQVVRGSLTADDVRATIAGMRGD